MEMNTELKDFNFTTPRMTKRIKQFKPKQGLSKAQVQSLIALMKTALEQHEINIKYFTRVAMYYKSFDTESAETYFKRADKTRKQRNKLSLIQAKLKRGLV